MNYMLFIGISYFQHLHEHIRLTCTDGIDFYLLFPKEEKIGILKQRA